MAISFSWEMMLRCATLRLPISSTSSFLSSARLGSEIQNRMVTSNSATKRGFLMAWLLTGSYTIAGGLDRRFFTSLLGDCESGTAVNFLTPPLIIIKGTSGFSSGPTRIHPFVGLYRRHWGCIRYERPG